MKEIEYKKSNSKKFEKYVGLGGYIHNEEGLQIYFPKSEPPTISEWRSYFQNNEYSIQIHTLNYFLLELNQNNKEYFKEIFGEEIFSTTSKHFELFEAFISKWYEPNSALFKGLDFTDDGGEIKNTIPNEEGNWKEIEFEDSSIIRFLDNDDSYSELFILKKDFGEFQRELKSLIDLF